jgi:hypothetical protein
MVAHHTRGTGTIVAHNTASREGELLSSHHEVKLLLYNNCLGSIVGVALLST